jgi:aspartyl-tRNA(Asn)/glutamyl-tRNA(Gln) amidotransferase subunit B
MKTRDLRAKEEAHDYRYFPEPDIPPVIVTESMLDEIRSELPELPDVRMQRFIMEYGMSEEDARILTEDRYLADFYEQVLSHVNNPKAVSNVVLTEVLRVLNEQSINIQDFSVSAEDLAGLVVLKEADKINSSALTKIFDAMVAGGKPAEHYAREMNLLQVSDTGFIEPIVEEVIDQHPDEVERYREGKKGLIGFFIGQVMQRSQGKANPNLVRELISEKLES